MKLNRLTLRNFKGQRQELTLEPNGKGLSVFGDNAVGKTSIFDGFCWLLSGKDSLNSAKAEFMPLDENGKAVKGLEVYVCGEFEVEDGKVKKFERTQVQNWVTKRGAADKVFSGTSTEYMVNDIGVTERDYIEQVKLLADPKTLLMLSNPDYFPGVIHWEERRMITLKACGDVTDAEVVAQDKKLAPLLDLMGEMTLDQFRTKIEGQRKKTSDAKEGIPALINENQMRLSGDKPEGSEGNAGSIAKEVGELQEAKARLSAGGEAAELTKQLRVLEGEAQAIANELSAKSGEESTKAQAALRIANSTLSEAETKADRLRMEIEADQKASASLADQMVQGREAWKVINSQQFTFTGEDICPACKQALPSDQVAAARSRAEEEFNLAKSKKLEQNNADGSALKTRKDALDERTAAKQKDLEVLEAEIVTLTATRDAAKHAADSVRVAAVDQNADPAYKAKKGEIDEIHVKLAAIQSGSSTQIQSIEAQIAERNARIQKINQAAAILAEREKAQVRIDELMAEEKKLGVSIETLDSQIFMCELFIKTKVKLLESRINSKFKLARFKLFHEQDNGGVRECCEVTYRGVPYGSLNHGSRINVGLDIIQTLSDYYGFTVPIFIDNAESVTSILPTSGQQIRLIVSEPDKTLRVEIDSDTNSQEQKAS